MGMKIDQILNVISDLACSQGSWGRLYSQWMELKREDSQSWHILVERLEAEEFETALDVVLFIEQGKSRFETVYDFHDEESNLNIFTDVRDEDLREKAAEAILLGLEDPDRQLSIKNIDTIKYFCKNTEWDVIENLLYLHFKISLEEHRIKVSK